MEAVLGISAMVLAGYLISREVGDDFPTPENTARKRVADYYVAGTTDVAEAMSSG